MSEEIETTKISELSRSTSFSGACVSGVDSNGNTKKFPIDGLGEIDNKVDKVQGKGLSTNDYSNEDKTKLGNIASGAQVNVIEVIKVNGTVQTVTDKTVNITTAVDPEVISNAEIDALFN